MQNFLIGPYAPGPAGEAVGVYQGDALTMLREMPDESVQMCVTSPPYWGLRDYGMDGQLGLEPTPELYVEHLVAVFHEVRRVLRRDGTLFLVIGDSYNGSGGAGGDYGPGGLKEGQPKYPGRKVSNLKPKDLVGIPWMCAFALRADGWWLRSDVIWAKPNPMPESVTDRPTRSHEYIFLLTKAARYYWDAEAIKEKSIDPESIKGRRKRNKRQCDLTEDSKLVQNFDRLNGEIYLARNARSVWTIPTHSYSGAHFATYPPALVEKCLRAGTSEKGACQKCGAAWRRVVERTGHRNKREPAYVPNHSDTKTDSTGWQPTRVATNNWQPGCACDAGDPIGCLVLDPFMGAGTTGLVAARLGLHYIGFELNPEYVIMARRRIINDAPMFAGGWRMNGGHNAT